MFVSRASPHHLFFCIPVPLMPPAILAGPPIVPRFVFERAMPVPLMPPTCAGGAEGAARTAYAGLVVEPILPTPAGTEVGATVVPICEAIAFGFKAALVPLAAPTAPTA